MTCWCRSRRTLVWYVGVFIDQAVLYAPTVPLKVTSGVNDSTAILETTATPVVKETNATPVVNETLFMET